MIIISTIKYVLPYSYYNHEEHIFSIHFTSVDYDLDVLMLSFIITVRIEVKSIEKGHETMIQVVFVCLGNICRSPMAEAVFRQLIKDADLTDKITVDSAGTSDWHIGKPPHEGTLDILNRYEVSSEGMQARQYIREDLAQFDYIVAMDTSNLENIHLRNEVEDGTKVFRLLDLIDEEDDKDVPDPYHTGDFDETYELVTNGSKKLLEKIRKTHQL